MYDILFVPPAQDRVLQAAGLIVWPRVSVPVRRSDLPRLGLLSHSSRISIISERGKTPVTPFRSAEGLLLVKVHSSGHIVKYESEDHS